ncbi:MAG: hypothetical protein ACOYOP_13305 [Microthrixaceae bacterium]
MSNTRFRGRALVAPLVLGMLALVAAACAPEPPPYKGIVFNTPSYSYVGKRFTPTATSTSGLPVSLALDASSSGCTFAGGVLTFVSVGNCVINANQPGNGTVPADPQVQKTIRIFTCPPLRSGTWSGPLNLSANVVASGSSFTGFVDLSSLGFGVQTFAGSVSCDVVNMTFNATPLTGVLSPDGSTLSSNYNGIDIVLNAPPA